ncbi:MAG: multiheme c-type cytochrome [Candidatus Hydrothermarchaeales archaeon]
MREVPLKECVLLFILTVLVVPAVMADADPVEGDPVFGPTVFPTVFETNKCYDCHSDSTKVEDMSPAEKWTKSVHAENGVGCESCHAASLPAGRLEASGAFVGSYREDHVDLILEPGAEVKSPSAFPIEGKTGEYSFVVRGGLIKQQLVAVCAR